MGILSKLFKREPRDQLRSMVGDFELPTFPRIAFEARKLLRDDNSTNQKIGECIKRDPGLTVRLLKTANSAAFSRRRSIGDVSHAVALLGRAQVEVLLLAHATQKILPDPKATGFSQDQFWSAAIQRATMAQRIAERIKPSEAALAFASSLLQDMAVPVLATALHDRYCPVLHASQGDWHELTRHERDTFGWDHGEVGAWMCEAWAFPDELTASIADHHGSENEELEAPIAVRAVSFLQQNEALADESRERITAFVEAQCGMHPEETRAAIAQAEEPDE